MAGFASFIPGLRFFIGSPASVVPAGTVGILYNTGSRAWGDWLIRYYGTSNTIPGSGLPLTVDETYFFADSTLITADATVTP